MTEQIQVMEDDKRTRCGVFQTGQKGTVPPLVTTDFAVEDTGHLSSLYHPFLSVTVFFTL